MQILAAVALLLSAGCGNGEDREAPPPSIDLTVDREALAGSILIEERDFAADDCALVEGAVPAPGRRRLLRFDTIIVNRGALDLVIGDPANPEPPFTRDDFEFSPCHRHHHFEGFAEYELRDTQRPVGFGHKQSFCVADFQAFSERPSNGYTCAFQGITAGWGDRYGSELDGQWVDITDLPSGDYTLVVTVNAARKIPEAHDVEADVVALPVRVPPPPAAAGPVTSPPSRTGTDHM
jgi:hypothetical protein